MMVGFLTVLVVGCAPAAASAPTATTQPTLTQAPTQSPHSLVVIKSTLGGDLLGVLIQNTDSDGKALDTLGLGFMCLSQAIYAVDENGARLECVQVTDATDSPNHIAIIFSGASSDHKYQLVRGEDAPIDFFPEQVAP
ncbi:MAG: hypothetical protein DPW18_19765 [Chloroflexi bacterium]|nr:MAG: hypothetical protein EDM79_19675 [Chloroflexota bacterium]MCQ3939256.1 hypothetical protein [Chloroflexota bacterium]MDL1945015.1 hypothetical protein [Chloroflexi bacterium CFX2]